MFVWEGLDDPVQVVCRAVDLPLDRRDWQDLGPVEHQQRLAAYLQADRERGFDLSQAPLLRLALIQIAPERFYFVWSHHHLLIDGWSSATLLQEVFGDYAALCQHTRSAWERSRPYRDYIAWLQQQDHAPTSPMRQRCSNCPPIDLVRRSSAFTERGTRFCCRWR